MLLPQQLGSLCISLIFMKEIWGSCPELHSTPWDLWIKAHSLPWLTQRMISSSWKVSPPSVVEWELLSSPGGPSSGGCAFSCLKATTWQALGLSCWLYPLPEQTGCATALHPIQIQRSHMSFMFFCLQLFSDTTLDITGLFWCVFASNNNKNRWP